MYVTPVIYPTSSISPKYQALIQFNPMSSVVEAFRYAYLGAGTVNLAQLAYSFGIMLLVIIIGTVMFNRVETTFMDTV
jgi:lipopolysaccharide transport system permease protein